MFNTNWFFLSRVDLESLTHTVVFGDVLMHFLGVSNVLFELEDKKWENKKRKKFFGLSNIVRNEKKVKIYLFIY